MSTGHKSWHLLCTGHSTVRGETVSTMEKQVSKKPGSKTAQSIKRPSEKYISVADEMAANVLWMQQTLGNQAVQHLATKHLPFGAGREDHTHRAIAAGVSSDLSVQGSGNQRQREILGSGLSRAFQTFDTGSDRVVGHSSASTRQMMEVGGLDEAQVPEPESAIVPAPDVDRRPDSDQPAPQTAAPETTAPIPLIVEDAAEDLQPGQMKKTEFLSELRAAVCRTAEEELAGTNQTVEGCPYIDYWFEFYANQDSVRVQRAIRKYAPETANTTEARDYFPIILTRVRRAVAEWARTGQITDVPEGVPTNLPGETDGESASSTSITERVSLEARVGGAKRGADSQNILQQIGAGRPLDAGVRERMESIYRMNFSHVRVHTDAEAAGLSNHMDARAFTIGKHIAFGSGEYRPGTLVGDALIAHELAHVVQQKGASPSDSLPREAKAENGSLERDADRSAMGAVVSMWGGAKAALLGVTRDAVPRLRSGLRLSRCSKSGGGSSTTATATPTLAASNDRYVDTTTTSEKTIRFDATIPSGLNKRDYALVNMVKGSATRSAGTYIQAMVYGSLAAINFPSWQVDSVDADPVYWSDTTGRWNYNNTSTGFWADDSPGLPGHVIDLGDTWAVNFKMGLYKLADVPTTTTGTISATPITEIPWQFSVARDATTGVISHPALTP